MDTILLTGQTGLFSKEILQYIGETAQVFVTGQKSAGAMKVLPDTVRLFPADQKMKIPTVLLSCAVIMEFPE